MLLAGCENGVDARIRHAHALGEHPTLANKDRIEALLKDEDRDVRATAIVVMEAIDRERAKRMAVAALDDADGLVRSVAVPLCGEGAGDEMIRRLAGLAVSDPAWQVRGRALTAIAAADDPAVYEAFLRVFSDGMWRVRQSALIAGMARPGLLPTDRVVELVYGDPSWENRVEGVRALGASLDRGAYAGLDLAMADPNEFVRASAARERRTLEASGVAR